MPFYAVKRGKKPGVYEKWNECQQQTIGFPGAQFKKFDTREEAEAFVKGGGNPKGKTSTSSGSSNDGKKAGANKRTKEGTKKKPSKGEDSEEESGNSGSETEESAGPTKKSKSDAESKSTGSTKGNGEQVYVSAACFNIGKKPVAGVGVVWASDSSNTLSEPLEFPGKPTINRAVIHAAVRLCKQIKDLNKSKVVINSGHSNLVQSMSSWVKKWKEKDWKTSSGGDVANKEDLQELVKAAEGLDIEWNLVGPEAEEQKEADRLAKQGAKKS